MIVHWQPDTRGLRRSRAAQLRDLALAALFAAAVVAAHLLTPF